MIIEDERDIREELALLLAVYNNGYRGGAAATIRHAHKLSRQIIIIDPATGKSVKTHKLAKNYNDNSLQVFRCLL